MQYCYAAECEALLGDAQAAAQYGDQAYAQLDNAYLLCSDAPVLATPVNCPTTKYAPCCSAKDYLACRSGVAAPLVVGGNAVAAASKIMAGARCDKRGEIVCSQADDREVLECDGSSYRALFLCMATTTCTQFVGHDIFECRVEENTKVTSQTDLGIPCVDQGDIACSLNQDSLLTCKGGVWSVRYECTTSECRYFGSAFGLSITDCTAARDRRRVGESCSSGEELVCGAGDPRTVLLCDTALDEYGSAFLCPGSTSCQDTQGGDSVACRSGPDDPEPLFVSRAGLPCVRNDTVACSPDRSALLTCQAGVWVQTRSCEGTPCARAGNTLTCGTPT